MCRHLHHPHPPSTKKKKKTNTYPYRIYNNVIMRNRFRMCVQHCGKRGEKCTLYSNSRNEKRKGNNGDVEEMERRRPRALRAARRW